MSRVVSDLGDPRLPKETTIKGAEGAHHLALRTQVYSTVTESGHEALQWGVGVDGRGLVKDMTLCCPGRTGGQGRRVSPEEERVDKDVNSEPKLEHNHAHEF